jgi:hypothetical protein
MISPIRVAPNGRFFETFDGEPFLFFGANDAMLWPGLEPLWRSRDLGAVEAYLRSYAENGTTILRLMLEYAHDDELYLENPVGHYRPEMLSAWDDLLALCERVGLRVLLTPWDTFWMARRWDRHPYNRQNGGPSDSPGAFFTDEATIAATQQRFEFIIERYRDRAVIAAWDLWNEIHPHWGGSPDEQSAVIARLSAAVRVAEQRVQGWTRPQTVSIFGPEPTGGYENLIFRHPELDFASTHIYSNGAIDFPRDTVTAASIMARWTRFGLSQTPEDRPFTDSEHGPIHLFNDRRRTLPAEFDDEYERHLMWAHLCSGGAGGGLRWPARHPHVLTEGMKRGIGNLAKFAREIDWRQFTPREARARFRLDGASRREMHLFAAGDDRQVVAFLLRRPPRGHRGPSPRMQPLAGMSVSINGLQGGDFETISYDPICGQVLSRQILRSHRRRIVVNLPDWEHEIAIAIRASKNL